MKFLLGAVGYGRHVQNTALAFYEAGALGAYYTGSVDNYRYGLTRGFRQLLKIILPSVDRQLRRRRITLLPNNLIYKIWAWEGLRVLSGRLGMNAVIQDWLWQRSEHSLDRKCSRLIKRPQFDAFFGFEHGSLFTIRAAKEEGKKSVIAFTSPHYTMRKEWVDVEYEKFPELLTPDRKRLMELAQMRDRRRDEEAHLADIICANSKLVAQSLIKAGFSESKIIVVPCGSLPPISDKLLPASLEKPIRFIYAGPVSAHKGIHYLIEAWKSISAGKTAELHLFGIPVLPRRYLANLEKNIFIHGSIAQENLFAEYQRGSMFVFPTLYDGFGMAVLEAMAHGLPVIATENCGASSFIEEGKNGFLVPPCDVNVLAERLEWCLNRPKELLEMRKCALLTAKRWAWADFRTLLREQLGRKGFVL